MQLLPAAHANHPPAYGDYYWPCAYYPQESGRPGSQHSPALNFHNTPNGTYKIGDTITIRSDRNQGVDNPSAVYPHTRLALETGDVDRFAVFSSETGPNQVYYTYTVQPGDYSDDLDYRAPIAGEWGGAMHWGVPRGDPWIKNVLANADTEAANCWLSTPGASDYSSGGATVPSLSFKYDVVVDGIIPRVENVTMAGGAYGAGSQNVSVNFAEPVFVYGPTPSLILALDGGNRTIPYLDGNGTSSLVFAYDVVPGDLADDLDYAGTGSLVPAAGGILTDYAGNNASLALPEPGSPGSLGATSNVSITAASGEVAAAGSPLPDGAYPAGYRITVVVNFTEPVVYSGAAPPPSLALNFSGANRTASYASGNDTRSLAFAYTVREGDQPVARLDYAGPDALQAGAGGLLDRAGDGVDYVLPWQNGAGQLGSSHSIAIDAEAAVYVTGVDLPGGASAYKLDDTVRIAVDFSAPVAVTGVPALALAVDPPRNATYVGGGGTRTLEFEYRVQQDDAAAGLDYAGVRALSLEGGAAIRLDAQGGGGASALLALPAPGGPGSLGHNRNTAIDGDVPTVAGVASASPDGTYGTGRIVEITVAFDEPVFVDGSPELRLATVPPRSASYAGGSGTAELAFWYTVQPGDSAPRLEYAGEDALALEGGASAIRDAAGNAAKLALPATESNRSLAASAGIDVHGHEAPVIAAAGSAGSATPNGVVVFELGGTTYAAVASAHYAADYRGDGGGGMQLFRVGGDGSLAAAGAIRDDQGAAGLQVVNAIDALTVGNTTYIATASWDAHGVQLILVNGSGAISAGMRAEHNVGGFDALFGSVGVDVFAMNDTVYALATSSDTGNGGVQLIRVNGSSLERVYSLTESNASALVQAGALPNEGTLALNVAHAVDVFEMAGGGDGDGASGNRTYAVVTARSENAVQLVRVHENGTLAPADSLRRVNNTDLELRGPRGIDAFKTAGGSTYAIVASYADNGVQLVRVHENGTLGAAGWLRDTTGLALEKPQTVHAFTMGNRTYAAVTTEADDGVQLVRVHENGTLSAAGMVVWGPGFRLNTGSQGIDVFAAGNHTYAIVTSYNKVEHITSRAEERRRGDVQVIRLSPASVESVSTSLPDGGTYLEGHRFNVTVDFDMPVSVSDPPPSLVLSLGSGGHRLAAEYLEGDGTDSLIFNYTVGPGDEASGALRHAGAGSMALLGAVADAGGKGPSNRQVRPPSMGDVVVDPIDPGRGPAAASLDLPGSPALLQNVVLDAAGPRVAGITELEPKGAAYMKDDTIKIAVAFHEPVVIPAGASPSLRLALGGGATAAAGFDRQSDGGRTLVFAYTVVDDDAADPLDYDGAGALSIPGGGTATDALGNPADLSLPFDDGRGLLAGAGIQIDTEPPRVVSISSPGGSGAYVADAKINITVSFDEDVYVTGAPTLALSTSPARSAEYVENTDGDADLEFLYTVQPGDGADSLDYATSGAQSLGGGTIRDAAGNDAVRGLPPRGNADSLAASGITIDAVPPVVRSAEAELRDRIRVTFDGGPVSSGAANASAGWSISGPSAGDLSVADLDPIPPSGALTMIVLKLDGHLPDTAPDITLSYDASAGGIVDGAGNALQSLPGIDVADRMAPELVEALITGPREVTIDYTEPVTASPDAYSNLDIAGVVRALEPHDTSAILRQHVLGFAGAEAPIPEPPSTITIDGRAVLDGADRPNPLGDGADTVEIRDGRVLEVYSSRITDLDTAVITYTRNATAQQDAYSSLVVAGLPRNITDLDGGGAEGHIHTITFSPGGAPPNATGSVVIDGAAVTSPSEPGMRLGDGMAAHTLADGQSPSVRSAVAASLDTIRVEFDEAVLDAGAGAAGGWSVSGGDAAGIAVASAQNAAEPSGTLTLTLDGPLPDTAPDSITLSYHPAAGSVEDGAGNALVASSTAVDDGIAPVVRSAVFSGPNEAEIRYTEPVWAGPGAYESVSLSSGGDPRPVTGLEGNGTDMHTVSFGGEPAGLDETGMLEVDAAAIRDAAMLPLGADGPIELGDTTPPSVSSAVAVSLDTIRVEFDEPVVDPGTGAGGWSVSGGDSAGLAVASSQNAAVPSDSLELTLDGQLPDTAPDAVVLLYDPAAGSVEDRAGNSLAASSTAVSDGIAPSITSSFVAGPSEAEIRYTEPVWASSGAYASVSLSSGGGDRPVEGLEGNGTDAHTVLFGGEPAGQGTTGTLVMDAASVRDAAMLPLGADAMLRLGLAGEAPAVVQPGEATARAVFAARNTVSITYSAPLGPPAGHSGPVYAEVAINGQGGGARPVSDVSGLGTAMHTVAFGGDGVDRNQTGTIVLAVGLEGAAGGGGDDGDRPRFAAGSIPVASGRTVQTVLLGQPQQGPQMPVRIEPDGFTRTVDGTAAGSSARLAINVTGLAQSSEDPGTAVFPAEAVTLAASFARVTFPPGVTATSVPAGGAISLYVDADTAENATSVLGYPAAGTLTLRTIVEVGGSQAPVLFDKPVRILLEGQAGGRAFYAEGANGTITPIDLACAADDTERVHRQLGGMGECRIDSGDDMVIHTYHLTRFGTAASDRGTPPPVVHTCSLRLDKADLAVEAVLGGYSKAVRQAVVNSGSQPFDRVALDATPWYVDPAPGTRAAGAPSLPASLTVESGTGQGGQFAPLPAGIADGLGGGQEKALWLAINLTGHAQVNGTRLVQDVAYTAECGG